MTSIRLRFKRTFFVRHGLICGMMLFFCIIIILVMRHAGVWRFVPLVCFLGPCLYMVSREYFLAAREVNDAGVTRHDGRRFLWSDLHEVREVHSILQHGQRGALNHVDLIFPTGKVRILYVVLENGWEAILFSRRKGDERLKILRKRLCELIARGGGRMAGKVERSGTDPGRYGWGGDTGGGESGAK